MTHIHNLTTLCPGNCPLLVHISMSCLWLPHIEINILSSSPLFVNIISLLFINIEEISQYLISEQWSVPWGSNFLVKRFFPHSAPSLRKLLCIYSWGKRSEQLTLLGWGSGADFVKNRGVLCCCCDHFKNNVRVMWEPLTQKISISRYYRVIHVWCHKLDNFYLLTGFPL